VADFIYQSLFRRGRSVARLARLLFLALITVLLASVYHGLRSLC